MQVIIFRLNDEQYALEAINVVSINKTMQITIVPRAPDYIKGLINLRGNIIPLLNIYLLINITPSEKDNKNIIISDNYGQLVGIEVDEVVEVLDIDINSIEKNIDKSIHNKGIINLKDRIVTLLELNSILT